MTKRDLFDHLHELQRKIKEADLLALLLDYDGTLVPFQDNPEEAVATNDLRRVLRALSRSPRCKVAIVSSRHLQSLKRALDVDGLTLAGLLGIQMESPDGNKFVWEPARELKPVLDKIKQKTVQELEGEEGVHIEDKEYILALHYRLPRESVETATQRFIDVKESLDVGDGLEIIRAIPGYHPWKPSPAEVLEIRPRGWNKGDAVREILSRLKDKGTLPLYFGDDETDEDAFSYLKDLGVTVRVSGDLNKATAANYSLRDHREVYRFLCWILKSIRRS
ncbi:MAG: trehalose-phosphatase [Candidatus Bathyarchaeia archaeon]